MFAPMKESTAIPSLARAEEICGGRAKFASLLGVSYSTVGMWHLRGSVPNSKLLDVQEVTRRKVTVQHLLADMRARSAAKAEAA
ncbi:MAG: YdaS family helix-turn-helix protein [Rhodospirillales bacterium]